MLSELLHVHRKQWHGFSFCLKESSGQSRLCCCQLISPALLPTVAQPALVSWPGSSPHLPPWSSCSALLSRLSVLCSHNQTSFSHTQEILSPLCAGVPVPRKPPLLPPRVGTSTALGVHDPPTSAPEVHGTEHRCKMCPLRPCQASSWKLRGLTCQVSPRKFTSPASQKGRATCGELRSLNDTRNAGIWTSSWPEEKIIAGILGPLGNLNTGRTWSSLSKVRKGAVVTEESALILRRGTLEHHGLNAVWSSTSL